jgi:hypothetical protein
VRNHLVRHAYEKPDGVAYSGWGYGNGVGLVLKAGSGNRLATNGYFKDHAELMHFLDRFHATKEGMAEHWKAALESRKAAAPS